MSSDNKIKKRYSHALLEHFHHTAHAGQLDDHRAQVVTASKEGVGQEYAIQFYLEIMPESGVIKVARFLAYGSTVVIACCEYSCRWVEGKRLNEAQQLDGASMITALGILAVQAHIAAMVLRLLQETLHRAAEQVST